jgi:hypothetical protein
MGEYSTISSSRINTRGRTRSASNGHSGIWIARALSKTGGKLITIEINERRYNEAQANFE